MFRTFDPRCFCTFCCVFFSLNKEAQFKETGQDSRTPEAPEINQ